MYKKVKKKSDAISANDDNDLSCLKFRQWKISLNIFIKIYALNCGWNFIFSY